MAWLDQAPPPATPCGRCGRHLNDIEISNRKRRKYRSHRPERVDWCTDCCDVEDEVELLTEPRYNLERDSRGNLTPEAMEVVREFLEDMERGRYKSLIQVARMLGMSDSRLGTIYHRIKKERAA